MFDEKDEWKGDLWKLRQKTSVCKADDVLSV